MGTDGIVLGKPTLGFLSDLAERQKAPGIKHTIVVDAIEAFDKGILSWFSGLGILDSDASG